MKESRRHNRVIEILYEISKSYKLYEPYNKIYAHHIKEKYRKIDLYETAKRGKAVRYSYEPDLWCGTKKKGIDIFEVWDTQGDKDCVEDIILSALVKNVSSLSIVCFSKDVYNRAETLINIILRPLHSEEGGYLLDPRKNVFIALLPEESLEDEKKIKEILKRELKFI